MKISREGWIIGIIAIIFIIILGVLITRSSSFVGGGVVKDPTILVRPNSHMTGTSGAKVTMVEFGDYQCPACAAAYPLIKQITEMYKSNPNFNFVFRNFPLPQHQFAQAAAEAAEAAGAQGKYWQMHDALYGGWNDWQASKDAMPFFIKYAQNIGLDLTKFQQEVSAKKYQSVIDADLADDSRLGLDHTPTVFINGEEQTDLSVAAMKAKIDSLLAK
jgi:protein-disulfide isomerase